MTMRTHSDRLTGGLTPALRTAALVVAVAAGSTRVLAQTPQTSTIEVGPSGVSDDSFKATEYNGLQQGFNAIGNLDLRGGAAGYNSASVKRWRISGHDLGTEARSLTAEAVQQGRFRVNIGYDELRRNRSDTYQSPFDGTGGSVLTLPTSWLVPTVAGSSATNTAVNVISTRGLIAPVGTASYINTATNSSTMGALLTPTSSQIGQVLAAINADVPLFHNVDLFTKRQRFDAAVSYAFDPQWGLDASFRPEHKDGLKPMGTVSRNTGADISTVIPDLIDNNHNQFNLLVHYNGAKTFAQAGYYGSMFTNNVTSMSWQNWATPTGVVNTISSTPGNNFSQLSATAGVTMSKATKLVVDGSYGRGTQDDRFLTDSTTPVVPVTSLNGLVVNTALRARLTARPAKKLNVTAGYKYDDRDNRTPVNIFQYADAGEAPAPNPNFVAGPANPLGAVLAQNANANRPYSRKLNQIAADADYSIVKGEWIKAGYEFEKIDRACPGSWIDCADAATTNENTLRAEWRTITAGEFTARVDYAYSARRAPDYNENAFLALVPYAGVTPASAIGGATALSFMNANGWTGYGPAAGYSATTGNANVFFPSNNALANAMYANNNRISELPGMRRYYVADRDRNKLRSLLTWQASEALSLQGGVDLTHDVYPSSIYGVQNSRAVAVNLDGTYVLADSLSANVAYTFETTRALTAGNSYTANSNAAAITNGQPGAIGLSGNTCDSFTTLQQRNNNNKLDPCLNWTGDAADLANTVVLGLRKQSGSLDLVGNVIVSHARWDNTMTGGSWVNNLLNGPGAAPTTVAAFYVAAAPVPTITTDSGELRLTGTLALGRGQSIRVGYSYLRMTSSDPAYEGAQLGSVSTLLPTNEQAFKYSVNVFGVSYIVAF
jgi:MtrB/PioB family decaheme-associated outer membrane protein